MKIKQPLLHTPYWIVVGIVLVANSCSTQKASQKPQEHMELGWVDRSVVQSSQYPWFDTVYAAYQPITDMLEDVQTKLDSAQFLIVFGTWCPDSKREVPRFFKIADLLNIRKDHIQLFAVDRSKQHPEGIPQQYSITNVPTFIVLEHGQEVGRIVEKPKTKLEFDLLEIFAPLMQK